MGKAVEKTETMRPVMCLSSVLLFAGTLFAASPDSTPDVKQLIRALKNPNPTTRADAATNLGLLGLAAREAVPALAEALADPEDQVRMAAVAALEEVGPGPEAIPLIAKALRKAITVDPWKAASALVQMGRTEGSLPYLIELLKDKHPLVRAAAAGAIREGGPKAAGAVPALINALRDPDPRVRDHAARAVEAVGPAANQAVPALIENLQYPTDWEVRRSAARALGSIGRKAQEAVPALKNALSDPDESVRLEAAEAIKKIGGSQPGATHRRLFEASSASRRK
jgi:HEAT repeat protein